MTALQRNKQAQRTAQNPAARSRLPFANFENGAGLELAKWGLPRYPEFHRQCPFWTWSVLTPDGYGPGVLIEARIITAQLWSCRLRDEYRLKLKMEAG